MKFSQLPPHLRKYYDQLCEVNRYSSGSWYYSTSQFFSKEGAYSALQKFNNGYRVNWKYIIIQSFKYVNRSFINLGLFFIIKTLHSISGQKCLQKDVETIYIDSYVVIDYALEGNGIIDNYFPGLVEILKEKQKNYTIIPRLYGSTSPLKMFRLFRYLKNQNINVLIEFELLTFIDFFRLALYTLIYPFKMLQIYSKKVKFIDDDGFLKFYFWYDLNGSNFFGGVRHFFAVKLAKQLSSGDKIIQWFENQTYERSLNWVINQTKLKVGIYGCQLFIYPLEEFNVYVDSSYSDLSLPQKVLVNGNYFLEDSEKMFKVGPSYRYRELFNTPIFDNINNKIVILFSYFEESNLNLINFLNNLKMGEEVIIKLHPTDSFEKYQKKIFFNHRVVNKSVYSLFQDSSLILGCSSGSLVEGIACGIPAIVIEKSDDLNFSYLPLNCKGYLWDSVSTYEEFHVTKHRLLSYVVNGSKDRFEKINWVREQMFCKPNNGSIDDDFEL